MPASTPFSGARLSSARLSGARLSSAREHYTFQGNRSSSRYGWLRLTPAYSVHLVRELLAERSPEQGRVLDPFCGTGTTLLACREAGLDCDTVDLNPFLIWLARAKAARYSEPTRLRARELVAEMADAAARPTGSKPWVPEIHRIERWWTRATLAALGRGFEKLDSAQADRAAANLARLAFCRALIDTAQVSFGHQSMSFRGQRHGRPSGARAVAASLSRAISLLDEGAQTPLPRTRARVLHGDSRALERVVGSERYAAVITSPPYCNRMSYIRELRPYMYWLGYLYDARGAGELDWKVIGGTWGAATSRLASWKPPNESQVDYRGFEHLVAQIAARSTVLGRYVARYFHDQSEHLESLAHVLRPGADVHYVVGNSKFFDILVPAEEIFAALFEARGFHRVRCRVLRKRSSKRELFEFLVSARWP